MNDLLDAMLEARLPWISPVVRTWYAEDRLREQLGTALTPEADRYANAGFGAEFRDALGFDAVTDPLDWANRRLDLSDGGWAVSGIRFRGRDMSRPFVDVVATSEPPTTDGLARVVQAVAPAYRAFAPLCLRVDAPDGPAMVRTLSLDDRFGACCAVDMHVVAERVSRLREHARSAAYPHVSLRLGEAERLTHRVAAIYEELVERELELATWADPEDEESLRECAEQDLLFEVLVDGSPAGVVAAVRDDAHAMRGFSVQEICLDRAHRGRRLAPAAVQRLVDELPAEDGDVLWGTIHPANEPSLRNALSVGRKLVGGYVWVTPHGLPGMSSTSG